jgi:hypothetical protein
MASGAPPQGAPLSSPLPFPAILGSSLVLVEPSRSGGGGPPEGRRWGRVPRFYGFNIDRRRPLIARVN